MTGARTDREWLRSAVLVAGAFTPVNLKTKTLRFLGSLDSSCTVRLTLVETDGDLMKLSALAFYRICPQVD